MKELQQYLGPQEWQRLIKESASQWMKWSREGYSPVLVFNHLTGDHLNRIANPVVWDEQKGMRPDAWKHHLFDETPGTLNISVGLGKIATEHYDREAAQPLFNDFLLVPEHGITGKLGDLREEYRKFHGTSTIAENERLDREL